MILGVAEIMVVANTAAFKKELEDSTAPAFAGLKDDAEIAGEDAGASLRGGVRKETEKIGDDLENATAPAFGNLRQDAKEAGEDAGGNLRKGVTEETGKLADDVEKDGEKAGDGLHKGMSGALSKLANLISNTGLPLGGLSSGLEKAGDSAEHAGEKSEGLAGTMDKLGGVALMGVAAAAGVVAVASLDMGEKMQSANAKIASASGTSVASADKIGSAFLSTGGKVEFSGITMATAFAGVAGQLKTTEGHALNAGQALNVMNASADLATAKQIDLGDATTVVAGIMQSFQLSTGQAAHVSDVLFSASNSTGQSVDALGSQLEKVRSKLGDVAPPLANMAGLLVDMTTQGITGRAAMASLNTAMTGLLKPADLTTTAGKLLAATQKQLGLQTFDSAGKFVGLGSIIAQLHPKFALMTQDQQLAAATTLFGAGAARQMVAVIAAGPAAYDKATASVTKMGAAHAAAAVQSKTLHVEEQTLGAEMSDLAARIGAVLIPIITAMVGALVKATSFVTSHKAALIALAAVVTGILGPAIAVFTINKMAAFGQSFMTAGQHVASFASGVQTAVQKVIGLFTQQTEASDTATANLEANSAKGVTAADTEATGIGVASGDITADNAAAGASFSEISAGATTGAADLVGPLATEVGEVTTADATIETENATAAASFAGIGTGAGAVAAGGAAAVGGVLGAAAAGLGAADVLNPSKPSAGIPGNPSSNRGSALGGAPSPTGGFTIPGIGLHVNIGAAGGYVDKPTLALIGEAGPEVLIPLNDLAGIAAQGIPLPGLGTAPKVSGELKGKPQTVKVEHSGTVKMTTDMATTASATTASASYSPTTWAEALLAKLGDRITQANVQALVGWETAEGGNWNNSAKYNPLNTTQGAAGSSTVNSAGVKAYTSWAEGLTATVQTLKSGAYGNILQTLAAGGSAGAVGSAIGSSPWGTSGSLVQQTIAGTHVKVSGSASKAQSNAIPAGVLSMLNEAEALVGSPYSKPNAANAFNETNAQIHQLGVDCSGFVSVLLKSGGIAKAYANTTGIASELTPGKGKYVTVYDRHTGDFGDQHALIDIMGKWFESGGNSRFNPNPNGGVTQLTAAQAQGEMHDGGAPFEAFHATGATNVGSAAGNAAVPSLNAAQKLAFARTQLALALGAETTIVGGMIKGIQASVAAGHVVTRRGERSAWGITPDTPAEKMAGGVKVDELKAGLQLLITGQTQQVNGASPEQKAALAKQTADLKGGATEMTKEVAAIHKGSMAALAPLVTKAHDAALTTLERSLDHDHSAALADLSKRLVQVHTQALAAEAKLVAAAAAKAAVAAAAAAATAAATAQATALTKASTLTADAAKATADDITDATKVYLDEQAASGLTGAALVAANAQTTMDSVTRSSDAAIDAAQTGVDQASGGTALAQAQAASVLAQAQASATVNEASAQSVLDKANALNTTAAATTSSTTVAPNMTFYINGNGTLTAAQLFSEAGWALRTGALPIALPPVAAPA